MVNLITPKARVSLMTLYYSRLFAVLFSALGSAVAVGAILLLPSYFFIHAEADQASQYVASAGGIAKERAKGAAQETLAAFNESVRLLHSAAREPSFAHIMTLSVQDKPRGISVSTIEVVYDATGTAHITLAGTASTRATLIAYADLLKKVPEFKSVVLPVSDLVADVGGDFTITADWVPPQKP